jgi:hypothetical protein
MLATALAWARAQRIVYHFSATPVEERTNVQTRTEGKKPR